VADKAGNGHLRVGGDGGDQIPARRGRIPTGGARRSCGRARERRRCAGAGAEEAAQGSAGAAVWIRPAASGRRSRGGDRGGCRAGRKEEEEAGTG
jgi:hypothetical protein